MTSTQAPSEKCPKCGEINPKTISTCNLCGSILPWFEAKRVAESRRQPTNQISPKLSKNSPGFQEEEGWFLLLLRRFPSYRGTETPTVTLGELELSLSHTAALLAVIFLALSAFAPLVNATITNVNLITSYPWLAYGSLLAAVITGTALVREQLRWCYASFFISALPIGFVTARILQGQGELVSPWRLLEWGVVPLLLGPLLCLIAAYFVGLPEQENMGVSNPLGRDEAALFQSRLYERVKELSKTQVFQQALRDNPESVKMHIQQLRGLTTWAQVPEPTKRLLERAEAEIDDGWALSTLSVPHPSKYQRERVPFWAWGLTAGVPVTAVLLFFIVSHLLLPHPIKRDLGVLPRREGRAKFAMEMGVEMLSYLNLLKSAHPNAPSYTLYAQMQMMPDNPRMAYGILTYNQEKKDIVFETGLVGSSVKPAVIQLASNIEPENIRLIADGYRDRMKADILKRQVESAQRDVQNSMQNLDSQFENFQLGIR